MERRGLLVACFVFMIGQARKSLCDSTKLHGIIRYLKCAKTANPKSDHCAALSRVEALGWKASALPEAVAAVFPCSNKQV